MFSSGGLMELLVAGWLATLPLAIGSVLSLSIFLERLWRFRGLESAARDAAASVISALSRRDLDAARAACKGSDAPIADMFGHALRYRDIAVEDLERILATARAEFAASLKRGIWLIGTTGSLAPFIGLFGTVVGIIRAFADMAEHGSGGFAVVAAGISEALVATALGLGVAIVALFFYNYLNVRMGAVNATHARAAEHFVHALLVGESAPAGADGEGADGSVGAAGRR